MNERIRKLAEQAGVQFGDHGKGEYVDVSDVKVLEKFAALIIRECSDISTETCTELKADDDGTLPGFKTILNSYMLTLRHNLSRKLVINL